MWGSDMRGSTVIDTPGNNNYMMSTSIGQTLSEVAPVPFQSLFPGHFIQQLSLASLTPPLLVM